MTGTTYTPTTTWTYPTASTPSETTIEETERYYDSEGRMVREVVKRTVTKAKPTPFGPYWGTQPGYL